MAESDRRDLDNLIADLTVFYQKLRHYHWNVKGPRFFDLHVKFEEIYNEVGMAIDAVAERVVALDGVPIHTLAHMLEATSLSEDPSLPAAEDMVRNLVSDLQTLSAEIVDMIADAEEANDRTTFNLLDGIHDGFEGHMWMLKSWLDE